jgi:xylulokinase
LTHTSPALLGLDVGTTGIKAVAFSPGGEELAKAIKPTPTRHHTNGHADYDPAELWAVCCSALRSVADRLREQKIEPIALGCTSMSEAGVLLDANLQPVYPIIPWFDYRTEPQIDWWHRHVGFDATAAICGVVPHPMFGMPKLMWIRDNEPQAYAAGRHWLNIGDYAEFRLCGEVSTDFSLASRTLVLDLSNKCWSDELIDAIGIRRGLLGALVPAGTVVGQLHDEAAADTGLARNLPIVRGGQDHVCAALAMGVSEPGVILDSIGTAEAFFLARTAPDMSGRLWPDELNQGVHVVPNLTYVMTGTGDGAGRIDAHRAEAGLDFAHYLAAAECRGPEQDMIESLAIDGQELFEKMVWAADLDQPGQVRHVATGGGTRIPRLMKRKRAIGGRVIQVPLVAEATCLGAAMLAGAGVGMYSSIGASAAEMGAP